MEQGSSSAKSQASTQQNHSFTDELIAVVSSAQNQVENDPRYGVPAQSEYQAPDFDAASNALQSHHSIGQLQVGEMVGASSATADPSAPFSYGNLLASGDHQQPLYPAAGPSLYNNSAILIDGGDSDSDSDSDDDEGPQNALYNIDPQIMNQTYRALPLSNLPQEYHHMSTAPLSAHHVPQIGSSQTLVPFESSMNHPSMNPGAGMNNAYMGAPPQAHGMMTQNDFFHQLRLMGGMPYNNQMMAPPGYEFGGNSMNNARTPNSALQLPFDQGASLNAPLHNVGAFHNPYPMPPPPPQLPQQHVTVEAPRAMRPTQGYPYPMSNFNLGIGSSGSCDRGPASSAALKRKMPQDDANPSYRNWSSFPGRGFQRYSPSNPYNGAERFTLYDKRYEDMGLPVDPHLRIFLAKNGGTWNSGGNGNGNGNGNGSGSGNGNGNGNGNGSGSGNGNNGYGNGNGNGNGTNGNGESSSSRRNE